MCHEIPEIADPVKAPVVYGYRFTVQNSMRPRSACCCTSLEPSGPISDRVNESLVQNGSHHKKKGDDLAIIAPEMAALKGLHYSTAALKGCTTRQQP
jgi:hypothetical protein